MSALTSFLHSLHINIIITQIQQIAKLVHENVLKKCRVINWQRNILLPFISPGAFHCFANELMFPAINNRGKYRRHLSKGK